MKEVHSPGTLKKNKVIDNRRRISGIANVRYISELAQMFTQRPE
jgi:hypothetical protein